VEIVSLFRQKTVLVAEPLQGAGRLVQVVAAVVMSALRRPERQAGMVTVLSSGGNNKKRISV
jgi:hypothetical protein